MKQELLDAIPKVISNAVADCSDQQALLSVIATVANCMGLLLTTYVVGSGNNPDKDIDFACEVGNRELEVALRAAGSNPDLALARGHSGATQLDRDQQVAAESMDLPGGVTVH